MVPGLVHDDAARCGGRGRGYRVHPYRPNTASSGHEGSVARKPWWEAQSVLHSAPPVEVTTQWCGIRLMTGPPPSQHLINEAASLQGVTNAGNAGWCGS
jgi:hypothetical protein